MSLLLPILVYAEFPVETKDATFVGLVYVEFQSRQRMLPLAELVDVEFPVEAKDATLAERLV